MEAAAVALVSATVFAWAVVSARLSRADLSAPIVFVSMGLLLSVLHLLQPDLSREAARGLAEVTLVWVLFGDASRVKLRAFREQLGLYARLLGVGLPLTIAAGALLAVWLLDGTSAWMALVIGAALAPTDAALGSAVMTDPAVPDPIRRVLNVESGLNDGIATPVVTVAIVGAAAAESFDGMSSVAAGLIEVAVGVLIGVLVGAAGGWAMRAARRRRWVSEDFAGPGVLALALAAYAATVSVGGNGFVAAFVGGLAFGNAAGRAEAKEVFYIEQTAGLMSSLTWLLFGAVAVPAVLDRMGWAVIAYAVLSLTLVRMVPVALALLGTGLPARAVAFVGWFGPRGLASIIFALLAVEQLHGEAEQAVAVIGLTVLLSVFAHGISAKPLASRFGESAAVATPTGG